MILTEYDVSYAVKEYLIKNNYTIITWNPPGSQGTFTIPNPAKDPTYKGQNGSESPDLIAFKENETLIIEAKDDLKKCISDIYKIRSLLDNDARKTLLFNICNKQMNALGIYYDAYLSNVKIGIAIPYNMNIDELKKEFDDIIFFIVKSNNEGWNSKKISNKEILIDAFDVFLK